VGLLGGPVEWDAEEMRMSVKGGGKQEEVADDGSMLYE